MTQAFKESHLHEGPLVFGQFRQSAVDGGTALPAVLYLIG
jgi:hypothetical protein